MLTETETVGCRDAKSLKRTASLMVAVAVAYEMKVGCCLSEVNSTVRGPCLTDQQRGSCIWTSRCVASKCAGKDSNIQYST